MFKIIENKGVGPLLFGMTKTEVRQTLLSEFRVFRRTPVSEERDNFWALGLIASYDKDSKLEAIEFNDTCEVLFDEINIISLDFKECQEFFKSRGYSLVIEPEALTSPELSISLWFPSVDDDDDDDDDGTEHKCQKCKSLLVGKPGYYNTISP